MGGIELDGSEFSRFRRDADVALSAGLALDDFERANRVHVDFLRRNGDPARLIVILNSLLRDTASLAEVASRSYPHALGFDKVILYTARPLGQLRLHVWWPGVVRRREHIHDHRFRFSSVVVAGRLQTHYFRADPHGRGFARFVEASDPQDHRWRFEASGTADLHEFLAVDMPATFSYTMAADVLHRIDAAPGIAVTLFLEGVSNQSSSSIFVGRGDDPPSAAQQIAMHPDGLGAKLEALCSLLSGNRPPVARQRSTARVDLPDLLNESAPFPTSEWRQHFVASQRKDSQPSTRRATLRLRDRASEVRAVMETIPGLALTDEERLAVMPPNMRTSHLPSPDRPYGHLAVRGSSGEPSITPVWLSAADGQILISSVENRHKVVATAVDPVASICIPTAIDGVMSLEVTGLVVQALDESKAVVRSIAKLYGVTGVRDHSDGGYTSWEEHEERHRVSLRIVASRILNTLGDAPESRQTPWFDQILSRRVREEVVTDWRARPHDEFLEVWERGDSVSEPSRMRDEISTLGYRRTPQGLERASRTYGHLACYDDGERLRARPIGYDLVRIGDETRIAFLVPENSPEFEAVHESPLVAMSVVKNEGGSVWLQSRGLIEVHDDGALLDSVVSRLEADYGRAHAALALRFARIDQQQEVPHVLVSISRQRLSSRYREDRMSRVWRARVGGQADS